MTEASMIFEFYHCKFLIIMKVIALKEFGGSINFEMKEIPIPTPQNNEVLVQVHAISINPVDSKTRRGDGLAEILKNVNPMILGWDISGVIIKSNSNRFKEGDGVFGMLNFPGYGGAYAEYVIARDSHIFLKPKTISHQEAAAASLAALTAWQTLFGVGKLEAGQKVLIHAASGGVGHYAIQMAKASGAYVIGTSSSKNREFVMGLGADEHIDYTSVNFEERVNDLDLVIDTIGGENLERSLKVLREKGILINLIENYPVQILEKALNENKTFHHHVVHSSGKDLEGIAEMLSQGRLKSHVTHNFNFENMEQAHELIDLGRTVGKITLTI
mgnify:FL=1